MFFKKSKEQKLFSTGDLVKIKKEASFKTDKDYYVLIDYVLEDMLSEKDELDENSMIGVVWGVSEKDIIKNELHARLWNHELKNYHIISQRHLEKI
jgi:hypothetical protein